MEAEKRKIAGCVPFTIRDQESKVLLITSRKVPGTLVFPKGGIDKKETEEEAAKRETWEEAGVHGTILQTLFDDSSSAEDSNSIEKKRRNLEGTWFLLRVEEICDDWPERHERHRLWLTIEEALNQPHLRSATRQLLELTEKVLNRAEDN